MNKKRIWISVLLALLLIGIYIAAVERNINEKSERLLELEYVMDTQPASALLLIKVVKSDPTTGQMTVRIRFRLEGDIAQDETTPNVNLRFVTNNAPGQQVFEFPQGRAMSRIEVTIPMEGDINQYPFDRYETNLWLLMDTPSLANQKPQTPVLPPLPAPETAKESDSQVSESYRAASEFEEIPPAEIIAQNYQAIPLSVSLSASTFGVKYGGEVIRKEGLGASRIHLVMTRPHNLINVSITIAVLIMLIAVSIVAMAIRAIASRGEKLDVLPLSLSIGLIFGLPALRNIQPGVPPVGVLEDYFSFLWAEMFVATAAIFMALMWAFIFVGRPKARP